MAWGELALYHLGWASWCLPGDWRDFTSAETKDLGGSACQSGTCLVSDRAAGEYVLFGRGRVYCLSGDIVS